MTHPTRDLAILFADVSGSTRLYEKLGDTTALRLIEEVLTQLKAVTLTYEGRVIKTIGDEIMCSFPSADAAFQAASEMQTKVSEIPAKDGVQLAIRVGFHYGPVIEDNNDVFGDSVNVAARMSGIAKGGQVITNEQTVRFLSPICKTCLRNLSALAVKGKEEDINIYEVIWQVSEDMTMMSGHFVPATPPTEPELSLEHQGTRLLMDGSRTAVSLGRDPSNDVVVADRMASRAHAKIEKRRDKFVLMDQSTNGTYVTFDGKAEISLRREELILRGKGTVSFGHSFAQDPTEVLHFDLKE